LGSRCVDKHHEEARKLVDDEDTGNGKQEHVQGDESDEGEESEGSEDVSVDKAEISTEQGGGKQSHSCESKHEFSESNRRSCWNFLPRTPTTVWLPELCALHICSFASAGMYVQSLPWTRRYSCTSSRNTFVLSDTELISESLTRPLYKGILGQKDLGAGGTLGAESQASNMQALLDSRLHADCVVLVEGKVLLAHRALIAKRRLSAEA
jgi:hypothetical protein